MRRNRMTAHYTPRERVMLALNHEEPDRVPIDFGSTYMTSITLPPYLALERALGLSPEPPCFHTPLSKVVLPREEILCRFRVDTRGIPRPDAPATWRNQVQADGTILDEFGVVWKQPSGQRHYEFLRGPFEGHPTLGDLQTFPCLDDPDDPRRVAGYRDRARHLCHETDYAVMAAIPGGFITWAQFLRGFEGWFLDLAADPKLAEALMDRVLDFLLALTGKLLDEVGPYIHIVTFGDDLAMQDGLMMSMHMFRGLIKPRLQRVFDFIRSRCDARLWFHTDGAVVPLIPDLVDLGVDILNPIQVTAKGMDDTRYLKREFGDDLVFWGGIDTQQLMPFGTPEQVRAEVRRRIVDMAGGGGYVLNSVHNIQGDVRPENIIALFDEGHAFGTYPLPDGRMHDESHAEGSGPRPDPSPGD
jgi:uroporphyrinogen decarboxylase